MEYSIARWGAVAMRSILLALFIALGFMFLGASSAHAGGDDGGNSLLGSVTEKVTKPVKKATTAVVDEVAAPSVKGTAPVVKNVANPVAESAAKVAVPAADNAVKPATNTAVKPMAENVAGPAVEHVAQPVVEKVARPEVERVATPVVEKVAAPVVKNVGAPVVKKAVAPVVDKVVKPAVDKTVTPLTETVARTIKKVVQPVADHVVHPAVDQVVKPVAEPVVSPVRETLRPVTKPAQDTVNSTVEPTTDAAKPVTEPVADPITNVAAEPMADAVVSPAPAHPAPSGTVADYAPTSTSTSGDPDSPTGVAQNSRASADSRTLVFDNGPMTIADDSAPTLQVHAEAIAQPSESAKATAVTTPTYLPDSDDQPTNSDDSTGMAVVPGPSGSVTSSQSGGTSAVADFVNHHFEALCTGLQRSMNPSWAMPNSITSDPGFSPD